MHDLRALRSDPDAFDAALKRRGLPPQSAEILAEDKARRDALTVLQSHQNRRRIWRARSGRRNARDRTVLLSRRSHAIAGRDGGVGSTWEDANRRVTALLENLPNILDASVPEGQDETDNVVLKQVGVVRDFCVYASPAFRTGGKTCCHGFLPPPRNLRGHVLPFCAVHWRGLSVRWVSFMLDMHVTHGGYQEMSVPLLV